MINFVVVAFQKVVWESCGNRIDWWKSISSGSMQVNFSFLIWFNMAVEFVLHSSVSCDHILQILQRPSAKSSRKKDINRFRENDFNFGWNQKLALKYTDWNMMCGCDVLCWCLYSYRCHHHRRRRRCRWCCFPLQQHTPFEKYKTGIINLVHSSFTTGQWILFRFFASSWDSINSPKRLLYFKLYFDGSMMHATLLLMLLYVCVRGFCPVYHVPM